MSDAGADAGRAGVATGTAWAPTLRGWSLFGLLAGVASAIEIAAWRTVDWNSGPDVRWLTGFNWRLSSPYFLLTFCASPLARLLPSAPTRWLLANRRYLGLAFAAVAAWQLAAIVVLGVRHPPDFRDVHVDPFQYVEDSIFMVLIAMAATSFRALSRHLSPAAWRRLHATGIYLLAGLFSINFLYFALNETTPTYVAIVAAFAVAWALRMLVWWRRRATLRAGKLFWGLTAVAAAGVLGTWSYFGLQRAAQAGHIAAVAGAFAVAYLLAPTLARPLARWWPQWATAALSVDRAWWRMAGSLALAACGVFLAVGAAMAAATPTGAPPWLAGPARGCAVTALCAGAAGAWLAWRSTRSTPGSRAGRLPA